MKERWPNNNALKRDRQNELYAYILKLVDDDEEFPSVGALMAVFKATSYDICARIDGLIKRNLIIVRPAKDRTKRIVEVVASGLKTKAPEPKPAFWTPEKLSLLSTLVNQKPRPTWFEISKRVGCSESGAQRKASELGYTRPVPQKGSVAPIVEADEHDPLLAKLIKVYGREPFKGPTHRPGVTLPVIPIKAVHVGREAPC